MLLHRRTVSFHECGGGAKIQTEIYYSLTGFIESGKDVRKLTKRY